MTSMSLHRRYLFGMASGAGSVVIKAATNLLIIPLMIHQLGVDAFGLYVLLIGMMEIALMLDLGVAPALATLLSGEALDHHEQPRPEQQNAAYIQAGHLIFIILAFGFLMAGLLITPAFAGWFHIPAGLSDRVPLLLGIVIVEGAVNIYCSFYRAVLLSHCLHQWTNIGNTGYYLLVNLGSLLLLALGYDLTGIFLLRLFASGLLLGLLARQSFRTESLLGRPGKRFQWRHLRKILALSGHGMLLNLSVIVSHKIDIFVIAWFLPVSAVGVYEIVFRFLGIATQVCVKLCEGSYPVFSHLARTEQREPAGSLFLRMSGFLGFSAGLMLLLVVAFYPELFALFSAGRISIGATWPLVWLVLPVVWSGVLQMPATAYLFTSGHHRYLTVSSVLTALANLVLSVILIHWLGLAGVALGTLIPQVIQHQAGLIRSTCRHLGIGFAKYMSGVYVKNLLPLILAGLWVLLGRFWIVDPADPALPAIVAIAVSAGMLAVVTWLLTGATGHERKLVEKKLAEL